MGQYTLAFDECDSIDPQRLGGKCASLVALTAAGIPVPPGFAVTSEAYAALLEVDGLNRRLEYLLGRLDTSDLRSVEELSAQLRSAILEQVLPPDVETAIRLAFAQLAGRCGREVPVAVRSSATAEDMPDASFAGQQDTYLWVCGIELLGRPTGRVSCCLQLPLQGRQNFITRLLGLQAGQPSHFHRRRLHDSQQFPSNRLIHRHTSERDATRLALIQPSTPAGVT